MPFNCNPKGVVDITNVFKQNLETGAPNFEKQKKISRYIYNLDLLFQNVQVSGISDGIAYYKRLIILGNRKRITFPTFLKKKSFKLLLGAEKINFL